MKRLKKSGIMLVVILVLSSVCIIISMSKFNTPNFIKGGMGIARIMLTDAEIVQIQRLKLQY